jgi:hypothetical protein
VNTLLLLSVLAALTLLVVVLVVRAGKRGTTRRTPSARGRTRGPGRGKGRVADEDPQQERLRQLREFQRAEKIREAAEEEEIQRRRAEQHAKHIETAEEAKLRKLRDFQRAEKTREAAEEAEREKGIVRPEVVVPMEMLIGHELVDLHRQEQQYKEISDRAEVDQVVAEARDLIVDLNMQFGWRPGEPSMADRLFNTDVESALGAAVSSGTVNFRLHAMVAHMRSFARAATGGRSELAKVMATRALLGTGQMTEEELETLQTARRYFGDEFAEASMQTDRMVRSQEVLAAKRLGRAASRERAQDGPDWSIANDRPRF